MILSHQHRFIFVHCRKVAGSSIKVALAPHLGPDDVLVGSIGEVMQESGSLNRFVLSHGLGPRGWPWFAAARLAGRDVGEALNIGVKRALKHQLGENPVHPAASTIASAFPCEWAEYFRFAFVRNPYEQAVSDYRFRARMTGRDDGFEAFLESRKRGGGGMVHRGGVSNWEMLSIDGVNPDMHFIGRYEDLKRDMARLFERLDLELPGSLPQMKMNRTGSDYASLYTSRARRLVEELHGMEIERFEYEFPY